jgi:membrane protein YqaA with SNARE-associated domain
MNLFTSRKGRKPNYDDFIQSKPILVILEILAKPKTWIRRLYNWVVKWASHKRAKTALAGLSFAESSFFPLPPDPLLMAMVFAKPKRWVRYASITLAASVAGGIFGYLIGFGLMESVGRWIVDSLHITKEFANFGVAYKENASLAVFTAAFTPVPYKIITLSAGAFRINFATFLVASFIGRGSRFFAVAGLSAYLGKKYKDQIERYIDLLSLLLLVVVIGLFFIIKH